MNSKTLSGKLPKQNFIARFKTGAFLLFKSSFAIYLLVATAAITSAYSTNTEQSKFFPHIPIKLRISCCPKRWEIEIGYTEGTGPGQYSCDASTDDCSLEVNDETP